MDICHKVLQAVHKNPSSRAVKKGSAVTMDEGGRGAKSSKDGEKPFDSMNNIVANMLLNMTRSAFTHCHSGFHYTYIYSFADCTAGGKCRLWEIQAV